MDDKATYLAAHQELANNRDEALWIKALTLRSGDEEGARYEYLRMRVEELKRSTNTQSTNLREPPFDLDRLSSGEYGLAKTYWLYGVMVNVLISFIIMLTGELKVNWLIAALTVISSGYYLLYWTPGIWASSRNYEGPVYLAWLAKISTIIGALFSLAGLISIKNL